MTQANPGPQQLQRIQQQLDAAERAGDTDEIERLSALLEKLAAEAQHRERPQ